MAKRPRDPNQLAKLIVDIATAKPKIMLAAQSGILPNGALAVSRVANHELNL